MTESQVVPPAQNVPPGSAVTGSAPVTDAGASPTRKRNNLLVFAGLMVTMLLASLD